MRHVPLRGASPRALGWIGLGPAPHGAPLTDHRGRYRRFRTPDAAKGAVEGTWP